MDAARERTLREAAIGAAHDIFAADDLGEPHDPLCHQFGMLDDVGGVRDHAGDQYPARTASPFPIPAIQRVARVRGLERIMTDANLQYEIDDVL